MVDRMGLIERLRGVIRAEPDERPYECQSCGTTFEVEYYTCPRCNGFSVDPRIEAGQGEA